MATDKLKVKFFRDALLNALGKVMPAVSNKSILPILQNISISVSGNGQIEFFATDLEIGISAVIETEYAEDAFSVAVPAKILYGLLSSSNALEVEISYRKTTMEIELKLEGNSVHSIQCQSTNEFPFPPKLPKKPAFSMSYRAFSSAAHNVAFSASDDESKPVINSVMINADENGEIEFFAVDGFRASYSKSSQETVNKNSKAIIPARAAMQMDKTFSSISDDVEFYVTPNSVIVKNGNVIVFSTAISGDYPDYKRIVDTVNSVSGVKAVLPTPAFKGICEQMNIVSSTSKYQKMSITFEKNGIGIMSEGSNSRGKSFLELELQGDISVSSVVVNVQFVLEFLKAVRGENVEIYVESDRKPVVFRLHQTEGYFHMIMPMVT